ncbi:hypothetical protein SLEP1_g53453 [Rubroshorea leprosula]|uniref:Uncharacterized protein n=1 Tax=Rubroshorea leprosula TaxID=152421 RepID=A0AAV5MAK1_9ROSI|nr:hypothetical protein SLEP1_g53453 [Rubroshorea leprosula]
MGANCFEFSVRTAPNFLCSCLNWLGLTLIALVPPILGSSRELPLHLPPASLPLQLRFLQLENYGS